MKKIILGLLILISTLSFGQKKSIGVMHTDIIVGKNLVDNTSIKAEEYIFPERIHETFMDTTSGFLTVQLRGLRKEKWLSNKGKILQYDLNNNNLLWSKKIAYQTSSLQQFSNTMIYTVANKSNCLDTKTGNELWEVNNDIYYVDPIDNIGVGYRVTNSSDYSNTLEGIDLKSGKVIWKRDLNREYGWNDVYYINDSTMIVVAAGLHSININSGKGWDYNTVTGKKDYRGTAAANALGVAAGLLTGTFAMSTGHNLVRDVVSNSLTDSSYIYFASKEQLSKIDKRTGRIAWKHEFSNDLASKSSVFMNDSVVFMINKGYAFMGYRQLNFGEAFIAAFDRETGKRKYQTLVNAKNNPILGFKLIDDEIYLVFKNRIAKYAIETGNLILKKYFPDENYGELKSFIGSQVFVTDEKENLVSLNLSDTSKVFVYTNQGKTISLDEQLNVTDTIEYEDLGIYYLRAGDFRFIANDNQTLIINDSGSQIAEIDATTNAFIIEDMLYDKRDKSFIAIDLKGIIKNE